MQMGPSQVPSHSCSQTAQQSCPTDHPSASFEIQEGESKGLLGGLSWDVSVGRGVAEDRVGSSYGVRQENTHLIRWDIRSARDQTLLNNRRQACMRAKHSWAPALRR